MKDLAKIQEFFSKPLGEAQEKDAVDTISMDIPLFLRMLEYSREDASQDMDLHDVTEKANLLGKERGILQMDDYDEIIGAAEDIKEGMGNEVGDKVYFRGDLGEKYPSSQGYYGIIEDTNSARNYNMNAIYMVTVYDKNDNEIKTIKTDWTNLTSKMMNEAELTEAYVPSNIKEFAKRKGVLPLVNKVAGWAEKVGARITGGTAIGYNYSTLVLDMEYQGSEIRINTDNDTVTLYDEPVNSFAQFKSVYDENNGTSGNNLEERIAEALNKINEELCPAGKAYIKKRKAAGEKSSAYLSGRAVKVCKGQMSGKAKKK